MAPQDRKKDLGVTLQHHERFQRPEMLTENNPMTALPQISRIQEFRAPAPNAEFIEPNTRKPTAKRSSQHIYITGLRGVVVIQSFLWTYFNTFAPILVSNSTPGPGYQNLLRVIFNVPLWNESFIYNFFIILSMRTMCVSFLENPSGQSYAASIIRRIVRMVVILAAGSGIATLIFSQIGTGFVDEFKVKLPNQSIETPVVVYDPIAAFNSIFDLFWITRDFYAQAANAFWPTQTMWVPSVIYFQSFTVYFLMIVLPYTRPKWHIQILGLFSLGSFWMGQWGWYSATGLMFADVATNTTLKTELRAGLKLKGDFRLPYWAVAALFAAIGIALKYTFVVLPQLSNSLLVLYPYLDLAENYSTTAYAAKGPYPRLDDWLIIVGILIVVELFQSAQYFFSFKPLAWLGDRSFSIFVAQCIFFWTGGIQLWLSLQEKNLSTASANTVVFIVGLLATAVFSEMFYRLIDLPSRWLAKHTYLWLVD